MTEDVLRFVVGPFRSNMYVVILRGGDAIVVDPGPGGFYKVLYLADRGLAMPRYVILTHAHFDSAADAEDIRETFSARIVMHVGEFSTYRNSRILAQVAGVRWRDPLPDIALTGDSVLVVSGYELVLIHTPGHTPGSLSLYMPQINTVFTGDLLLSNGTVGAEPSLGLAEALRSLRKLVRLVPQNARLLPARGSPGVLGDAFRMALMRAEGA